ncbi:MAG: hypothetical protein V4671_12475 [Armatimonadota bacterium]
MNETPRPSSSEETNHSPSQETLPSEQEEFTPSVLDEPGVDVEEYLQSKQKAARRTRRFLQFALGVAVIAIPVTYLKINGRLNSNTVRQALNQKVDAPTKTAGGNPTFSLGTDPSPLKVTIPKTKKSKAVAQDLTNYVYKDLKDINLDELKALAAFDKVTGKNFTTDAVTFTVVRDTVIPAYSRFTRQAEAIQPKTLEVRAVHKIFVQSAKVKELAFRHLLEGQGDKTAAWQYGVKAEFGASAELANVFKSSVSSLAEDQGVKLP